MKLSKTSKILILCSVLFAGGYFYFDGLRAGVFESVLPITSSDLSPVTDELKDPESAQFRKLERRGKGICGEVNAKNSLGGYVGYKIFYIGSDKTVKYDDIACY